MAIRPRRWSGSFSSTTRPIFQDGAARRRLPGRTGSCSLVLWQRQSLRPPKRADHREDVRPERREEDLRADLRHGQGHEGTAHQDVHGRERDRREGSSEAARQVHDVRSGAGPQLVHGMVRAGSGNEGALQVPRVAGQLRGAGRGRAGTVGRAERPQQRRERRCARRRPDGVRLRLPALQIRDRPARGLEGLRGLGAAAGGRGKQLDVRISGRHVVRRGLGRRKRHAREHRVPDPGQPGGQPVEDGEGQAADAPGGRRGADVRLGGRRRPEVRGRLPEAD